MSSYDLIVLGSYPRQGATHGKGTVGGAMCTKNTLLAISEKCPDLKILVLSEKLPKERNEYDEANVHVSRCWKIGHPFSIIATLFQIIKNPHTTPILIEFEMSNFGGPLVNVVVPLILLKLKLLGYKVTFVLHQVVINYNEISGHIGQSRNSPVNTLLSLLSRIFYSLVVSLSHRVIVFDQFLKDRIGSHNPKIKVIPLGVETDPLAEKSVPITSKSKFVITAFGFLAWYKGTDWLIKSFADHFKKNPASPYQLVIAGGPNPNHLSKPFYQKYLKEIISLVKKFPGKIYLTGFVDEHDISKIYKDSDLILLPYRVAMSSSGPLSLTFTYRKPFMVSSPIAPLFETDDIKNIFADHNIDPDVITFKLDSHDLFDRLDYLRTHPELRQKLSDISGDVYKSRNWLHVNQSYLECLGL